MPGEGERLSIAELVASAVEKALQGRSARRIQEQEDREMRFERLERRLSQAAGQVRMIGSLLEHAGEANRAKKYLEMETDMREAMSELWILEDVVLGRS